MACAKPLLVLCCLASVCLSSSSSFSSSSLSSSATSAKQLYAADFFYLTLKWPGSYCKKNIIGQTKCCVPLTGLPAFDSFFVYALLPYSSITGQPATDCATTECRFNINAIPFDRIEVLYRHWPDVDCPRNNGYDQWKHIWCTYGVCSNLNQSDYFVSALDLRAKVDLYSLLTKNGITPSTKKQYKLSDIKEVLTAKLGFSTVIDCTRSWFWRSTEISEIRICVSSDAKKIISCPIQQEETCEASVWFLPFTCDMLQNGCSTVRGNTIELPSQDLTTIEL